MWRLKKALKTPIETAQLINGERSIQSKMIFLHQSISIRNLAYNYLTSTTWTVNYNRVQQDTEGISKINTTTFTSSNNNQQYIMGHNKVTKFNWNHMRTSMNQSQENNHKVLIPPSNAAHQTTLLKGTNQYSRLCLLKSFFFWLIG